MRFLEICLQNKHFRVYSYILNFSFNFKLVLIPVHKLWESVIVLCFVVRYFMSILVLQSSWWGRESWLLCLICLPGVSWWLSGSSSRCHGVFCSLWLWYFLIILIYYFLLNFIPFFVNRVDYDPHCFSWQEKYISIRKINCSTGVTETQKLIKHSHTGLILTQNLL